jgi:hypothetical protein
MHALDVSGETLVALRIVVLEADKFLLAVTFKQEGAA